MPLVPRRISASCGMLVIMAATGLVSQDRPPFLDRALRGGGTATMSGEHLGSAVAFVTWVTTRDSVDGPHRLELLVVWRGQAGWWRGRASASGGGGRDTFGWTGRRGDIELRLELDRAARVAQIQGERVELGDSNVVLVDGVDDPGGSTIAALARVSPDVALAGSRPDIDAVLLSSPEAMSFLQCDVPLPGATSPLRGSTCAKALGGNAAAPGR